ncbi:MAG: hypothetical protein H7287_02815 [Thermoleophilia bacterium]|nr:hypothetical protein [Thermoleophilia bacterium]
MRIKTFQGRTLEDLLPEIRESLGAGAVVLGQRQKVTGGIGGFFGTKVLEVTAADRMPDDQQLIELEDSLMNGSSHAGERDSRPDDAADRDPAEAALAARFRSAMAGAAAKSPSLDVTDEWDPAQDAELASEYGRVLEHAAAAGFTELDVPVVDPMAQAQSLAARAHQHVAAATQRVDPDPAASLAVPAQPGTYAMPTPVPRPAPAPQPAPT